MLLCHPRGLVKSPTCFQSPQIVSNMITELVYFDKPLRSYKLLKIVINYEIRNLDISSSQHNVTFNNRSIVTASAKFQRPNSAPFRGLDIIDFIFSKNSGFAVSTAEDEDLPAGDVDSGEMSSTKRHRRCFTDLIEAEILFNLRNVAVINYYSFFRHNSLRKGPLNYFFIYYLKRSNT